MKTTITFIGTGEAFDPHRVNSSYLIRVNKKTILVDCGYDVPKALMHHLEANNQSVVEVPDSILITHEHGDHIAGLPALLMAIWEEVNGIAGNLYLGLDRKLDIISANLNIPDRVRSRVTMDYLGFIERFENEGPELNIGVIIEPVMLHGIKISFAQTIHGAKNYAYRFDLPSGKSFAISGDGTMSDDSSQLYQGVDMLIHEGFQIAGDAGTNHATVEQIVDFAHASQINNVAIVHMNREQRKLTEKIKQIRERAMGKNVYLFFPEDHDELVL